MTRIPACPRKFRRSLVAAAVSCCFVAGAANGNPVGPTVAHGQATFAAQGKTLTVTNSPGSVINWQSFSIGASETTRFVQQSASSAVLNRVVGQQGSAILGTLQSNGRVFLINPNGIIFGSGALIDTAGLVASTLNMMDADFLSGKLRFGNTPGAGPISNAGEIRTPLGGRVLLIAPGGVENSGVIHSPKGEVILAAGKSVEIADSLNPEVRVELAAPQARAVNLGKIVAESGKVGIYGGIVTNHGIVSANSAVLGENGKIVLKSTQETRLGAGSVTSASGSAGGKIEVSSTAGTTLVAGSIQATGSADAGGDIRVLGERVGVIDNASIDASGARGGGSVLIGGDARGANPDVQNAQMTYVGPQATIKANAVTHGTGGKVIAWADDTLRSHGAISARGGARGGDGGFVETSGKAGLQVTKGPDVRAPAGKAGSWLLDPNDIEIVAGQSFDSTINTGAPFFAPLTDTSVIGADLINAQLDFGSNVTINTTSRGATAGTQLGNITLSASLLKRAQTEPGGVVIGTTSLTLQAHNNIVIAPGVSIASTGDPLNVTLEGPTGGSAAGGTITIGGPITTNGGFLTARAVGDVTSNAAINTMNSLGTFGSSVQFQATTGAVNVAAAVNGGNVSAFGNAGVNFNAPINATSSVSGTANAGKVTVAAGLTSAGTVTLTGRDGVQITAGTPVSAGTFSSFNATVTGATGSLDIDAGAAVTSRGTTLRADNMEILGTLNAGSGTVNLRPQTVGRSMFLGANTAGGLSLTNAELNNITTSGARFIGDGITGPIVVNAPLSLGSSRIEIESQSTYTQNAGAAVTSTVPLTITAPGGVILSSTLNATDITIETNTFTPNATVTSGSDILIRPTLGGRPINLGVAAAGATSLDLTSAQLNNLITGATGTLTLGSSSSGVLTIQGPIAPTGTSTLVLASGTSIGQSATGIITVPNLALDGFGNVNLPQANVVGTLAADLCCAGSTFVFANAPTAPLTIGTVAGVTGLRNFNSNATNTAEIITNNLTINAQVSFANGTVTLKPNAAATRVDLGGADAAGVLGLSTTDLANVSAGTLIIKGDQVDITAAVAPNVSTLSIVPFTAGRTINFVSGPKNPGSLDFVQGDITNVTANTLSFGDANTGAVNVNAALSVPNTINTFALNTPEAATGVTVNAAITADRSVQINADTATLNSTITSTTGSIGIAPFTSGRAVDLGTKTAGKLGLTATEIQSRLSAAAGNLTFGSTTAGNIDQTAPLNVTAATNVLLTTNNASTITIPASTTLASTGSLHLSAARITQNTGSIISSAAGDVNLTADRMDINAAVNAPAGRITVAPRNNRSITVGTDDTASTLGFTAAELSRFAPQTTLQIGNTTSTSNITLTLDPPPANPPTLIMPAGVQTLSLVTGSGSITQNAQNVIQVNNLRASARNGITLDQNNNVGTFAATTEFGNINFTHSAATPLNIGTVDGVNGVSVTSTFSGNNVRIRSDELNINSPISITTANRTVTLLPFNANRGVDLGTKVGGLLSFTDTELNRVMATNLVIGDTSTANITGSANISAGGVSNVTLTNGSTATTAMNATFAVPGSLTFNTGTLNTTGILNSVDGVTISADATSLGASVNTATAGSITIRPLTAGRQINVGGPDVAGTALGIDSAELGRLNAGSGGIIIGNNTAGDMLITHGGTVAGNVSLLTGGLATFSSGFGAGGALSVTANTMAIPGASISGGTGVNITTATGGRAINLGTKPNSGTALELDAAELARISTGAGGTLSIDTSGTLTTTAALPLTTISNLTLSGNTLTHTGGALSAPDVITLRGNTMTLGNTVTSSNNNRITVAPRNSRSMNLGTNPAAGALGLTPAEIARLTTTGVVQLGEQSNTTAINITAPLAQPGSSSALVLASSGNITQTAGSTITASNLRLQGGSVNLAENNAVGTLAGTSSGTFAFTGTGTLTVGVVDGATGIIDGTVTLKADSLDIAQAIIANTTNLAPRAAGGAIDLGTDSGFGLTDAEIDRISSFNLNIGNNTSGAITVSAPIDRAFGALTLNPQAGSAININAALTVPSTLTINAGLGGTVNIAAAVQSSSNVSTTANSIIVGAPIVSGSNVTLTSAAGATGTAITINQPITAQNSVSLTADSQSINGAITSQFGSISLTPRTNVPINLGGETAGALSINTSELSLLSSSQVTIGSGTAGALTVTAPIGPFSYDTLSLQSGGDITQLPGATITVRKENPTNPNIVTGTLNITSGGKILLPEDNNIAVRVSGTASGAANNFEFNNITPLKLQNVSGVFATGKVIIEAPPGALVLTQSGGAQQAAAEIVTSVLKAQDTQDTADDDAKKRKEDKAKEEDAKDKKDGKEKKACS